MCRRMPPDLFLCRSVNDPENNVDLQLGRRLHEVLRSGGSEVPYRQNVAFVRANLELVRLNGDIKTWDPVSRAI